MSVASLTDPFHVIDVADEIESFINVLLYNAVERLPHSHEDHMKDIMKYFLESSSDHSYRLCGEKKRNAVVEGLGITVQGTAVTFGTSKVPNEPLNALLYTIFQRFQARYVVLAYDQQDTPTSPFHNSPSTDDSDKQDGLPPSQRPRVASMNFDQYGATVRPKKRVPAPSDETRGLAKLLETHRATIDLFNMVNARNGWPPNEVLANHSLKSQIGRAHV